MVYNLDTYLSKDDYLIIFQNLYNIFTKHDQ